MRYHHPVFRPPSEAGSLILQVTHGCSHNRCTFCSMYPGQQFQALPRDEVRELIAEASAEVGDDVRRVFLADGDAMCLSSSRLQEILAQLRERFPHLTRVGIYANARDVQRKTDDELRALRAADLKIVYMGLESGDDETLRQVEKGATVAEIVEAVQRAQAAEMAVSVMVLIGLAGRERSLIHARTSAAAVNQMEPAYTALLTYTPVPGSPLYEEIAAGRFEVPGPTESLEEIHAFIQDLDCQTYFTCNHASNYLPLKGHFPKAKRRLLETIEAGLRGEVPLKPEFLRGL